jgi:putative transposase
VFFTPLDKSVYLGLLKQYSEHYGLRILGYCLMTNPVHLVVVPSSEHSLGMDWESCVVEPFCA